MTTNAEVLRESLGQLYLKRTIGDVTERVFQHQLAEKTVDLYRAVIRDKLAQGEELVAEHHTISSHFRMTQSVLKEPENHAISFFLTNRRLLRLRSTLLPGQPPTADKRDDTVVDWIGLDLISALRTKRQFRLGEAGVGAAMCCLAAVLSPWLSITGPFIFGLGFVGISHAFFLPTRWIEMRSSDGALDSEPVIIPAVKKKSARKLIKLLREKARQQ
jgi:hypothetical protein